MQELTTVTRGMKREKVRMVDAVNKLLGFFDDVDVEEEDYNKVLDAAGDIEEKAISYNEEVEGAKARVWQILKSRPSEQDHSDEFQGAAPVPPRF